MSRRFDPGRTVATRPGTLPPCSYLIRITSAAPAGELCVLPRQDGSCALVHSQHPALPLQPVIVTLRMSKESAAGEAPRQNPLVLLYDRSGLKLFVYTSSVLRS